MEILKLAVCGFGRRGRMCAWCSHNKKEEKQYEIAYVIDTNPEAIRLAIEEFGIKKEHCFTSLEDFYAAGITDCRAMAICTQDRQHFPHAMSALEHGYDLLVEKPVSYCAEECVALAEAAKKYGKDIFVCHVLRYAPFYMKMREIIKSGVLGEIVNVMATENVGIVNHYSASFIRGPWHRSDTTSPMILAKSCHDMDIILYLTGLSCVSLNSYGNRFYFNKEHKPEGAAERCLDCKYKDECIFYAPTVYQKEKDNNGWLKNMIAADPTDEIVQKAMEEGREGKCVFQLDNNIVDHQTVNMVLSNNATATFTMKAFSDKCFRSIRIAGTKGEMYGIVEDNKIHVDIYWKDKYDIDLAEYCEGLDDGHGGGDQRMMDNFHDFLRNGNTTESSTLIDRSIESHLMCFAAEESRVKGGEKIEIADFYEEVKKKI